MRHGLILAVLLAIAAVALLPPVQAAPGKAIFGSPAEPKPESKEKAGEGAEKLAQFAGTKVKDFATQADEEMETLSRNRAFGWLLVGIGSLLGALCMFFGWTLVKSLLIPFAPVLGLSTGGVIAFCIIQGFYAGQGRPVWFRLTVLATGAGLGVAGYLFSALRAKPVAAFLVVMSPFLIISSVLFSYQVFAHDEILALVLFCVGFLMGFAAMIEVRPVSIVSTALLGACVLLGVLGVVSHLMGDQLAFLRDFFTWLTGNPAMLGVAVAVLAVMGSGFQFSTGPRGTLES
jgi:hypothetical protein